MKVGAYTDIGKVRQVNEDSFYIPQDISKDIPLFIVADGMGGHNAGEIASSLAINTVASYISEKFQECVKDRQNILRLLTEGILRANHVIYEKSLNDSSLEGMGTTLVAVLVYNNRLFIGHVGDSRIYVARRNKIYQLTRDHSYVEQLVKSGTITREQAANHPQKNIITRALGTDLVVEIDVSVRRTYAEDNLVLCTDGLTNLVSNEHIMQKISEQISCQQIAEDLVQTANEAGGTDNITVIVIKN